MFVKQSHNCGVFLISYHFKILASFCRTGFDQDIHSILMSWFQQGES